MLPAPRDLRHRLVPIVLNQGLGFLCGVASVRLATEWVSPSDYGAYGVFVSFTPLGVSVVHVGLMKGVLRHWMASEDRPALLSESVRLGLRQLPWLAAACLLVLAGSGLHPWWLHWLLLFASASLLSLAGLAQMGLQAQASHWADCGAGAVSSLCRTLLPLLLYGTVSASLLLLELGFALHCLLQALVTWLLLRATRRGGGAGAQLESVYTGYQFPLLAIAGWLMSALNRWLVSGFYGVDQAGYFLLACNMSLVMTGMLSVVFLQYHQPALFAEAAGGHAPLWRRLQRMTLCFLLLAGPGLLALWAIGPLLIGPLVHERYRPALDWLVPSGCFGIALALVQFNQALLLAARREILCRVTDPLLAAIFCLGGLLACLVGGDWFRHWLCLTPVFPLLVTHLWIRRRL